MIELRTVIPLIKHGSQGFAFQWRGADGEPLDLAGWTLAIAEVSTGLTGFLTASIEDALTGKIIGGIVWNDDIPDGLQSWFRLQLTKDGSDPLAFPRLWVQVQ